MLGNLTSTSNSTTPNFVLEVTNSSTLTLDDVVSPKPSSRCKKRKRSEKASDSPKPYKCDKCPKSFARIGNLKLHNMCHDPEKSFSCPHCDRRFVFNGHLVQHLRVHTSPTLKRPKLEDSATFAPKDESSQHSESDEEAKFDDKFSDGYDFSSRSDAARKWVIDNDYEFDTYLDEYLGRNDMYHDFVTVVLNFGEF